MFKPGTKSVKTLSTIQGTRAVRQPATRAARSLEDAVRGDVKIRWNSRTGTVRSMRGILTEPGDGSPQEIARQFLREQRELFGIHEEQTDLQHLRTIEQRGIRHVTFRQVYQGIPVFGAEICVHIDQADRVKMVNGEHHADIDVDLSVEPISKSAALYTVMSHLEIEGAPPADAGIELVIFPKGAAYYRAYQVRLDTRMPLGNWVYFVDAVSGNVLDGYNAMRFVKGKTRIFNSNPKRDNEETITTPLFDLIGNRTLSGTHFQVINAEGPEALAASDAHEFLYEPNDSHFDETMVYYHLSRVAEFFRNLGYTNQIGLMLAYVHLPDPDTGNPHYDNAFYSPLKNAIFFGHGDVFNDLSWEAGVIYHEYTHAIIEAAQPIMGTHEASALHEGYADFFACSMTNDAQIGEYVVGQSGKPYLRNLRNNKTYQDFTGFDVHLDGEIWGITCWKIREALGTRIADRLLYESLWFLPGNATFLDASDGILQADTDLFSGEHIAELETIFAEQHIGEEPTPQTFTIAAASGDGGSIEPDGDVIVQRGQNQVFSIVPDTGYAINSVLVDGAEHGKIVQYTFEQVQADHTIAAQFAQSGGEHEWIVIVPGATQWMETGIVVSAGDILTFAAHGSVVYNRRGNACGPEGTSWTDTRDKEDPLWAESHGGLIGRIGEAGAPIFIGTTHTVTAAHGGLLFCGVNDFWYQGNTGEFTVTISVLRTL